MSAIAKKPSAHRATDLIDDLVAFLANPDPARGEPLIVENRIAQTKSVHVVVIWDQWRDMPPTDRSNVILEAYSKSKRLRGLTITIAMGLTSEQALRMGLLPYSIVVTRRNGDAPALKQLEAAMERAGGVVLKVGSSTQLRFPTQTQVEEAYRKLSQEIPGPYWAIMHEESAEN